MCRNFRTCSSIAATTFGWEWPVDVTAIPAVKSRNSAPSMSVIQRPSPLAIATNTTELAQAEAIAPVTRVRATRIGFLSDDHNTRDDGSDLPAEVLEAFRGAGCDLIVHLGHMGVRDDTLGRGVLDRLSAVA